MGFIKTIVAQKKPLNKSVRYNYNMSIMEFGHIEGTKVGQIFDSRIELGRSGIHRQTMAGIWSIKGVGASSIVLSGGYEDDIDELDYILYTGHGGQDVPGGKQVTDQEFVKGNEGLRLSYEYKLPIRVTRGFQIKNGPSKGYRYDGLYYVTGIERTIGKSGFYICRFHLESEENVDTLEERLKSSFKPSYKSPERTSSTVNRVRRNSKLGEKVKEMYKHKCQVCNVFLKTPIGAISIGAHIKGLGRPHNGPDIIENMLCLCPNHHDQFDSYSFYIDSSSYKVTGLDGYDSKTITISKKHHIGKEFLDYHHSEFLKNI